MQAAAVEILAEAQLPSAQALAITKAMELEVNASIETLATKTQLAEVRTELKADILAVRNELKAEIAALRADLKAEIAALRAELKADMLALRAEFDLFRESMRAEFARAEARLLRTVIALFVAQTATLLGGVYVMIHA